MIGPVAEVAHAGLQSFGPQAGGKSPEKCPGEYVV
jgi:hypothetical protein